MFDRSHPPRPSATSQPRNPIFSARSPIFYARAIQIVLLLCITFTMIGATGSQYDRVGHQLMCSCGCGQILLECNHVGCPDSPVMIRELHALTDAAAASSDKSIFNWFVAKYGPIILAAPIREGFDRVAWIVPLSVFFLATIGTFAVVWMWKRRAAAFPIPAMPTSAPLPSDLRDRIRQETEY